MIPDLLTLELDTEVTMFEVSELGNQIGSETFRFCAYSGVVFNGYSYNPLPCQIEGIEYTSEGALPRPKLTVSDVQQLISGLIFLYDGLEGSRVTIKKTLRRYLDGQPDGGFGLQKPEDTFVISQITQMVPGKYVEFELAADFDFVDETMPRRICGKSCPWIYRGKECGYVGTRMFTITNQGTLDPKLDVCAKSITACQLRFGKNVPLPFGGFPGLSLS